MGQYYYVLNLDKKEYLHPHQLGDGLKFGEMCQGGTAAALAFLLADNEGKAGSGAWAGDRIQLAGDYGKFREENDIGCDWTNISLRVREEMSAAYQWGGECFGKRWDQ